MRISDWSSDVCSSDLVVERGDVDAGVADLAVDVRARRGVFAVQGDGVEDGGKARGRLADGQVMEAAGGALGRAFAGGHADRVFAGAAVGRSEEDRTEVESLMRLEYAVRCLNKKIRSYRKQRYR